ncbi:MAG: methionine ABC transporter ATP-binding protein [Campylobacter sp.]|uniref:methionine ABC transporter ATP-binding protein n=2 Tax=Campylobacter sp. TaxID=205 RepID=UPI002A81B373|nr:methionine ABC transporter ATP-binding protein [Campylobacter sp.]MCI7587693.1 methionine ABC transporter ATP-binding protein [Campylobacter sp.]MDY5115403.1 methionine ABC transporter ATP-binding protein [Campylobacter sp.]
MIKISNLKKYYDKNLIINDVSCEINKGEIFAIVGHSGAGKSTLLRCINGLESYQSGLLKVFGKEIKELKERELKELRRDIGMIFQHFALLVQKNAFENIALPLRVWGYDENTIKARVYELLELVGLRDKASSFPNQLSGGQKQRIAIARALALSPKILLSDEATSALDPNTTRQILELLKRINRELGITIVLVTHEMDVIKSSANRAVLMDGGKIVEQGSIEELFLCPSEVMRGFLGEAEVLGEGTNIRLSFPQNIASKGFIADMARHLDIEFSIVWGRLERLGEHVLGSLIICLKENDAKSVLDFAKAHGVIAELIKE